MAMGAIMAQRGRPLPFQVREQIKVLRPEKPLREVAKITKTAINTVRKYETKFDTNR